MLNSFNATNEGVIYGLLVVNSLKLTLLLGNSLLGINLPSILANACLVTASSTSTEPN